VIAVMLSTVAPARAEAGLWCWLFGGCGGGSPSGSQASEQRSAPEIDPNALVNALVLVAGGAAILVDRLRRR
jgi:hypothetical protein